MSYQDFLGFVLNRNLNRNGNDEDSDFFVSHPIAPNHKFILSATETLTLLIENPSSTFLVSAIEK